MVKAIWKGKGVVAESNDTQMVENNHYFPPDSIKSEFFQPVEGYTTRCGWKGTCYYYNLVTKDGAPPLEKVAWTYRDPLPAAKHIDGYVAFYKMRGVEIKE
mmetsp:Transcript_15190/g.33244  ORF Transcript_15190/g.33244 Transcript_15190/m.33244 type:complete len:101 (+) Transcript_15190:259-561(+)|eukprot:CAMPEP_0168780530 /NCGR_PEP_ID=MMETSP0725-20121227/8165_1 /TAXON_ID=265536 /ORGANISM="Amphiprora sp., Strain CCMP467" /LENGTH=100 /DNA_ID=CAMNT_0008830373 /DNA_START=194 /DNA_END=496 /DNA_ORIENTATION=+